MSNWHMTDRPSYWLRWQFEFIKVNPELVVKVTLPEIEVQP